MNENQQTDKQFFNSLKKYTTLFYLGKGEPFILVNQKWHSSFLCVSASCLAYALCIWFFSFSDFFKHQEEYSPKKNLLLLIINIFMLIGLTISFLITQFMNPGIRNPFSISEQEFNKFGRKFCYYCEKQVLQTMYHCKQCEACIDKRDHHCMFFQKCMGGSVQQYGFKFFLLFTTLSCLTLFTTLILYLI